MKSVDHRDAQVFSANDILKRLLSERVQPDVLKLTETGNYIALNVFINNHYHLGGEGKVKASVTSLKNEDGMTALHIAARGNKLPCLRLLLNIRADREARDKYGWTPLHYAADRGYKAVMLDLLRGVGVNRDIPDNNGYTPLHLAARGGFVELMDMLVTAFPDKGADVNGVTTCGNTPLHLACYKKHKRAVEYLLAHRANTATKSKGYKTATDVAQSRDIKNLLLAHSLSLAQKKGKDEILAESVKESTAAAAAAAVEAQSKRHREHAKSVKKGTSGGSPQRPNSREARARHSSSIHNPHPSNASVSSIESQQKMDSQVII